MALLAVGAVGAGSVFVACSSSPSSGFVATTSPDGSTTFQPTPDGSTGTGNDGSSTVLPPGSDAALMATPDAGLPPPDGSMTVMTSTTIYVHSDTELYSMDPSTHAITDIGTFSGLSGSTYDATITDLAVDAAGEIYVNSETVVYKAALPATPGAGAKVQLTSFLNTAPGLADGGTPAQRYYALAFAPAGAIGVATIPSGETLVGGDGNGNLWVIPATGAPVNVGTFGKDPNVAANILALSGDLVFYTDATGNATGLATIRSCVAATPSKCTKTNDYLAGINMANLKANAMTPTSTPASLLGGIYGGTATTDGNGTTKAELFGLGAWQNDVYAFSRCYGCYDGGANTPASLVQIDTTTGAGTVLASNFPFTNGWSGAGVTTKVTITVVPPPPTMNPK